uniref:Uncharacterized protein n=1 Tax=Rhodnius prolixus TaxID=13249 RepID=T1IBX8_RHOPR
MVFLQMMKNQKMQKLYPKHQLPLLRKKIIFH